MNIIPLPYDDIISKLSRKEPFQLTRWGDGEWLALLGRTPGPEWGVDEHRVDLPGLPEALRESAQKLTGYCTTMGPKNKIIVNRKLWPEITEWCTENIPDIEWYHFDGLTQAVRAGEIWRLLEALRTVKLAVVGPEHLKPIVPRLNADEFVTVPSKNAFMDYERIASQVRELDVDVVTFSAGMTSEVLIPNLWDGTKTLMDVGALWDPFCGKLSRSWHFETLPQLKNAMSRAIVVLGLPRTGSSALAGAIHRFGIDMGEGYWQPRDELNYRGYYEDLRWQNIHKPATGYRYTIDVKLRERHLKAYERLIKQLNEQPLWGFKSPRTVFVYPTLQPMLSEHRVVVIEREWEHTVKSYTRHSQRAYGGKQAVSEEQADTVLARWHEALEQSVTECEHPIYRIQFEDLIGDTERIVRELAKFAYAGTPLDYTEKQIETACRWIDPEMTHFGGAE